MTATAHCMLINHHKGELIMKQNPTVSQVPVLPCLASPDHIGTRDHLMKLLDLWSSLPQDVWALALTGLKKAIGQLG